MKVEPSGLSKAVAAVTIGIFCRVSSSLMNADTLVTWSVYCMLTQLGPATQVSACLSNSQLARLIHEVEWTWKTFLLLTATCLLNVSDS